MIIIIKHAKVNATELAGEFVPEDHGIGAVDAWLIRLTAIFQDNKVTC